MSFVTPAENTGTNISGKNSMKRTFNQGNMKSWDFVHRTFAKQQSSMLTRWLSGSAGNRLEFDQNDDNDESSEKYF